MANKNRIAYAICSAHGIDTTGMSPKEAWEKAKEVADKNELADLTQDSPKETEKEEPKEEKVDYVKLRTGNKLSSQAKDTGKTEFHNYLYEVSNDSPNNEFLRDLKENYDEIINDVLQRALTTSDPKKLEKIKANIGGEINRKNIERYLTNKMKKIDEIQKRYKNEEIQDVEIDEQTQLNNIKQEFNEQSKKRNLKKEKKATIVLGPAAAGKSSLVGKDYLKDNGMVEIDADIFKNYIKEYRDDPDNISIVHEASSEMTKRMLSQALKDGYNVAIPKLGTNKKSIEKVITQLRDAGYSIELSMVGIDPKENAKRHLSRALSSGRLISSDIIGSQYGSKAKAIEETYEALKGSVDKYSKMIDNKIVERR